MSQSLASTSIIDESFLDRCGADVRAAYAYWDRKRGGRQMPRRADIDPVELKPYLSNLLIVDVLPDPWRFRYRLIGTRNVAFRGRDTTGQDVADGLVGGDRNQILALYRYVAETGGCLYDFAPLRSENGRYLSDESLYLPLSEDGHTVSQILVYSTIVDMDERILARNADATRKPEPTTVKQSGSVDFSKRSCADLRNQLPQSWPAQEGLYRYWDAVRHGRRFPDRAAIDAIEIKPWLGQINILDVLHPLDFRYRLYGSGLGQISGYDLTGKLLSALTAEQQIVVAGFYKAVVDLGVPALLVNFVLEEGKEHQHLSRLILPLGPTDDTVTGLLVHVQTMSAAEGAALRPLLPLFHLISA